MRQEVDKALDSDTTYRECQDEYNNAVKAWLADKTDDNNNAMQSCEENLRTVFDSIVKPIAICHKARMAKLRGKKVKLETA